MASPEPSKGVSKPKPVLSTVLWTHWLARKDKTNFEKKKHLQKNKFLNNYSFIFRHNVIGCIHSSTIRCTFFIIFFKGTIFSSIAIER